MQFFVIFLYLFFYLECQGVSAVTPVVLWHGIAASCCTGLMNDIKKTIEAELGAYVLPLKIGNTTEAEVLNTFVLHPNEQIKIACDIVTSDEKLKNGFNAIGLSQGGQFFRGLVQRCPQAKVKNLITFASQHQGVYGIPNCNPEDHKKGFFCRIVRKVFSEICNNRWIQNNIVQAGYWHDPSNEKAYCDSGSFISDINNEKIINQNYIDNLQKLNLFVMVRCNNDTTVIPIESSWFGFYKPGQDEEIIPLEKSNVFNSLGLWKMMNESKLKFLQLDGDHLEFTMEWFVPNIVEPYLRN